MANSISKDSLEVYFEYGIDYKNRRLFLLDDISSDNVNQIIKGIYYLDSLSCERPIELFINSNGGDCYEMFALYDVLNTTKCPIHTIAVGKCMSATPLLIAAGEVDQRYSMENTLFMIHRVSTSINDFPLGDFNAEVTVVNNLEEKWCKLLEKHSKMDAKFWKKLLLRKENIYFDSEQAIEWGIVDHIWNEKE